ncbi:unnamed protein product [Ostreobium quekettii]|uniref:Uncharacterized protein n=1 Tax=Ostreobium quekettii TaxID=121088 RepID=A0A8S1ILD9_9CHLO|nr:unnamed protein product [Ostreobium quekettii]
MPFMDVLLHGCDSSNSTNSVRKLHGMGMGPDCRRGADKGNGPSAEDMFNIKEGSAIAEKEKLASEATLCRTQVALLEDAVSRQQETLRRAARLPHNQGTLSLSAPLFLCASAPESHLTGIRDFVCQGKRMAPSHLFSKRWNHFDMTISLAPSQVRRSADGCLFILHHFTRKKISAEQLKCISHLANGSYHDTLDGRWPCGCSVLSV